MKTPEFLYWLQGWFEIEEPTIISTKQVLIIKKHIDLTLKYSELNKETKLKDNLMPVIHAIKGILEMDKIDEASTSYVAYLLNNAFKHEIDPSYGDKDIQDVLNNIHKNNHYSEFVTGKGDNEVLRC